MLMLFNPNPARDCGCRRGECTGYMGPFARRESDWLMGMCLDYQALKLAGLAGKVSPLDRAP